MKSLGGGMFFKILLNSNFCWIRAVQTQTGVSKEQTEDAAKHGRLVKVS